MQSNGPDLFHLPHHNTLLTRSQIICGFYGALRAGSVAENIKEPAGLKLHTGLMAELTQKLIDLSNKAVNDFISSNRFIKHMGRVGEWDRDEIAR